MTRPNIVYILADDMGYGDVSCLNPESKIHTQHLDAAAAAGIVFTDAHASSAVCTPSRYSILTGRYNWRSRLKAGVTEGYSASIIERDRMTVASLLKLQGYATACIGKWHLGWTWPKKSAEGGNDEENVDFTAPITDGPTSHGFDYFFGISASLDMPPYVYVENDLPTAVPDHVTFNIGEPKVGNHGVGQGFWRKGPTAPDFRHEEVLPKLTDKAIDYIDDHAGGDEPFFLYFPLPAPHTPVLPTPEFRGKTGTNDYGDFCLQVDDVFGRVAEALQRNGIAENTILIFTSDNGCSPIADFPTLEKLGHHPSYVFRGHKADIYEGGHRIPLIIRWPAEIAPGRVCDDTVCLVDLMATCADITSQTLPDNAGEDSVSNLPLWRGEAMGHSLREATVHHSINGSFSIRQGRWKLEMCPGSGGWSPPRPADCEGLPPIQLYDLTADIGERRNVADEQPEVVQKLTALLTDYVANGRSTPGQPQDNTGGPLWEQLWWMHEGK